MSDSILGKWNYRKDNPWNNQVVDDLTYEFFADGTYTYYNAVSGRRNQSNYEISGNTLTYLGTGATEEISFPNGELRMISRHGTQVVDITLNRI